VNRSPDAASGGRKIDETQPLSAPATVESGYKRARGPVPPRGPRLKERAPRAAGRGAVLVPSSPPVQFPARRESASQQVEQQVKQFEDASQQVRRGARSRGAAELLSDDCMATARGGRLDGVNEGAARDHVTTVECGSWGGGGGITAAGAALDGANGGGIRQEEERGKASVPSLLAARPAAGQVKEEKALRSAVEQESQVVGGVAGSGENSGWLQALATFRRAVSALQRGQQQHVIPE